MDGLQALLVVTLVAALAPMVVAALPGPDIPQVVVYPFIAIALARRGRAVPAGPDAAVAGPGAVLLSAGL